MRNRCLSSQIRTLGSPFQDDEGTPPGARVHNFKFSGASRMACEASRAGVCGQAGRDQNASRSPWHAVCYDVVVGSSVSFNPDFSTGGVASGREGV